MRSVLLAPIRALCAMGFLLSSGTAASESASTAEFPRPTALIIAHPGDLLSPPVELDSTDPRRYIRLMPDLEDIPEGVDFCLIIPKARNSRISADGRTWLDFEPMNLGADELQYVPREVLLRALSQGGLLVRRDPILANTASWVGLRLFALEPGEELHLGPNMQWLFRKHIESQLGAESKDPSGSPRPIRNLVPPQHPNETAFDVQSYDLFIQPDLSNTAGSITSASMTMHAVALAPLTVVPLDFDPNTPSAPALVIQRVDQGPGTAALPWVQDGAQLRILVTLPQTLQSGDSFTIRVTYSGTPTPSFTGQLARPFTVSTQGPSNKPVVYTASQPYGGRRWFPSKDRPDDKATTTTMRISVPSGQNYQVVSNGTLREVLTGATSGFETWVWENSYPIPTYLMAFYATDYVFTPEAVYMALDGVTTMGIRHAIYSQNVPFEGQGHLGTLSVMNFMADRFGEYPFLREKYWTASWNISFGIEHQTATGMPGANSGANTAASVGNGLTRRNIHELAHMWYGNAVTYATFDHAWLGEGFATYAEALWEEHVGGATAFQAYVANNFSASRVAMNTTLPIVGPNSDAYNVQVIYRRGAWVLHMLRRELGETDFWKLMKDWVAPPALSPAESFRSAVSSDFRAMAEQISGRNLEAFFQQWLERPNTDGPVFPELSVVPTLRQQGFNFELDLGIRQRQTGSTPFDLLVDCHIRLADGTTTVVSVRNNSQFLTTTTVALGALRPLRVDVDPEFWLLKTLVPSMVTVGLPDMIAGSPSYSAAVISASVAATGTAATWTWSAVSLPPFLSFNSTTRQLTATTTQVTPGVYPVILTMASTTPTQSFTVTYQLTVLPPAPLPPIPPVVINEVLVDPYPDATDAGEYIELLNTGGQTADLSQWQLVLLDGSGSGSTYQTISFPAGSSLGPGGRTVVGTTATLNAVYPGAVNGLGANLDNVLRQTVPSGVALVTPDGRRADSVRWRSDAPFAGPDAPLVTTSFGTGRPLSRTLGETDRQFVLGRWPDGYNTNNNLLDFRVMPPSPGQANTLPITAGTLPFTDGFSTLLPAWKGLFTDPRIVDPLAAGKPGKVSPNGGNVLEVYDASGGGDVAILPTDLSSILVSGYLWIPQDMGGAPWSTGVGLGSGHDSAWFSNSNGFGIEHGFYLEYQNGSVPMKGGVLPGHGGSVVLWAVHGTASIGVGATATTASVLGSRILAVGERNEWADFELGVDPLTNRLVGKLHGHTLYDGPIPKGLWPQSWSLIVGFRENHTGPPTSVNREGTWVDGITLGTVVPVAVTAFQVE